LRRLNARRREGRFPNCLAVKDMYRCTKKKEPPYTLYGSQSKEIGSTQIVDLKTEEVTIQYFIIFLKLPVTLAHVGQRAVPVAGARAAVDLS